MISRRTLKQRMPGFVRTALLRLRDRLNGPGLEADVLRDIAFTPENTATPRLTLIMPDLRRDTAFGGVMTALDLVSDMRTPLQDAGIALRIVSDAPIPPDGTVLDKVPGLAGVEVLSLADTGRKLPLRAAEICLVYNWWISINLTPALDAQAKYFNAPERPRIHLIQDYEPQFYGYSAAHLLAHQAMGLGDGLWAVLNTRELHDYWAQQGHEAARTFVFEPRMNTVLKPYTETLGATEKTRTILVYGRPNVPRNAFFVIERGLKAWGAAHGHRHPDWRIVSAGTPHDDVDLGGGQSLRSLGKLSLEGYAGLLRETAIGLSLMVSPHPSYPPLEMAHFGVRVLTNAFTGKDPAARHDNLHALTGFRPEDISDALEVQISAFEAQPEGGLRAESRMADFLSGDSISCAAPLAEAIVAEIGPNSASVV